MSRRNKALPVAICTTAFLVAWLGALHAIAQDVPTPPAAAADRVLPTPEQTQAALAQLSQQIAAGATPEQAVKAIASQAAAVAGAEPAPPEAVPAPPPVEMRTDGAIITHMPLQDASIRTVLRVLAKHSKKNILASKNVTGTVTADLFDVTFREALDSLMRVNDLAYVEEGNFIYVYTAEELAKLQADQRPLMTQVFRLNYMKPTDAKDLIAPCLSDLGKVAATPEAAAGINTSSADAGGMDYATNDVLVVTDFEENLLDVARMLAEADCRPQQVLIEATIMSARLDEDNALGIDFSTLDGVNLGGKSALIATSNGNVTGGLSFEWVGSDIQVFLDAVENVTDVNILANPKLLVLNKQRGEIIVGNEDGYLDTTTIAETGTTQSVSFLKTGTRLVVRPFIGENGYVRLEVHPEDSDGQIINGLPTKITTECTSNVIVKDGHTIVISGMFRETATTGRTQVPVLGNVPVLGAAFRKTDDSIGREEMIILITPRIIKQASDEAVSEQLRDDAERFRMGMREQLQWFGRSRLANRHFNWAKEHMAQGNMGMALWDLNMALSMSPAMLEAIRYKEELTGKAIWANEPRKSSSRWVIQTMVMNDIGANINTVVPPHRPLDPTTLPSDVKDAAGIRPRFDEPIMPKAKVEPVADQAAAGDDVQSCRPVVDAAAAASEPFMTAEAMAAEDTAVALEP